ncbi:M48 family metallopeptidase [Ruminococcus flavefaciens]|uniref:YgjP-like metallopeptidase domain-containing protein n=1 Tax=Ruminococcus flavefaciens 007c TaxID=1341157 RepID=W7UXA6_RUMFL|nr:SprT family zinc-dependent metalloprotease [Ruminococcus flavefaciens]EWM53310.1 hypothetical protein RF007C_10080 [Ruminococcus flavefaciens 007c]
MKVISSETRTVTAVCGSIEYTLERKAVRNINLRVRRDCTVYVSAPRRVPVKEIEAFIRLKSSYIEQAKEYYKKLAAAAAVKSVFADGSTVKLLGKDMVLKIIPSDRREVTCDGSCIYIRTKNTDISHAEKLYRSWLSDVCEKELGNILKEVHKDFIPLGVPLPQLKIRTMKARWGSCHYNKGMIMLNRRLIEAPRHCIAHVAAHELCHFLYPDHSKEFYRLLDKMCPDWRRAKAQLEKLVIL